jgi:hypothetical protein
MRQYSEKRDAFIERRRTVEVLSNKSGIVNGIFFQDEMMRKMFEKFPEVLLIDATYKQIKLRLPDIFP